MNLRRFLTRKNLILAAAGLLALWALIVGLNGVTSYLSQRTVTFTLAPGVQSAVITNNESGINCSSNCPQIVKETLTASGQLKLVDGTYSVTPTGDNITSERTYVTVSKDSTTFTIDPNYSDGYLTGLVEQETTPVLNALEAAYPGVATQYTIGEGTLYKHGDWYITSLTPISNSGVDVYHTVLHKTNGTWQVAAKPDLHFTYADYPSVPKDILYQANIGN